MTDGIRAVDGGVLQGQGAVAVVVDIVVVCDGPVGGQGAVGVGQPVTAVKHIGAAHGEGGGCRQGAYLVVGRQQAGGRPQGLGHRFPGPRRGTGGLRRGRGFRGGFRVGGFYRGRVQTRPTGCRVRRADRAVRIHSIRCTADGTGALLLFQTGAVCPPGKSRSGHGAAQHGQGQQGAYQTFLHKLFPPIYTNPGRVRYRSDAAGRLRP